MTDRLPGGREGLAVVFVLMVVLAVTGLATIALNLALAEVRLASAVRHRVGSDLLAEGAAALAMLVPFPAPTGPSGGPVGSAGSLGRWESGEAGSEVSWLSSELALVRAWGRTRRAPAERWAGTLGWVLDPSVQLGSGMPLIAAGGTVEVPAGFAPAIDSCGSAPPTLWGPGPLPTRWTSPLDLALGWRGERPPSAEEMESLRLLDGRGALVLLGDGAVAGVDSTGPVLAVAAGDLTLYPETHLSGLLLVAGDLRIATSASFAGVVRVLGGIILDAGAELVVSPCRAARGLDSTGWGEGLSPVHGFVGLLPL